MSQERLMKILLGPHVSEKSTIAADRNRQYVFKVINDATKPEVKQAVEMLFEVKVDAVQISNVKGKTRRFGQIMGQRKKWKKAYVSLKEGHELNFGGAD